MSELRIAIHLDLVPASMTITNQDEVHEDIQAGKQALVKELCEKSSNTKILTRLGDIYQFMGQNEDAVLCYRGILPACANDDYLDGQKYAKKIVASVDAADAQYLSAFPASTKQLISPPRHAQVDVVAPIFKTQKTQVDESFVVTLKNGYVWFDGLNLLVVDGAKNMLKEHVRGNKYLAYYSMQNNVSTHLKGRACFLDARSTQVYYHFLIDMLPKLGILDKCGIDSIDHFIVPNAKPWQMDILIRYGIPREKMISSGPRCFFTADELIVPALNNDKDLETFGGMGLALQPWIPEFHRSRIIGRYVDKPSRRIFFSRGDENGRGILQSDALEAMLRCFDFEIVRPEKLSFDEQAQLMNESKIIIGAHGSAFTNCVFCSTSTTLVEIFRTNFVNPAFWSLANTIGMGYHQYFIDEGMLTDRVKIFEKLHELRNQPISIDVEHFSSAVENIITAVEE